MKKTLIKPLYLSLILCLLAGCSAGSVTSPVSSVPEETGNKTEKTLIVYYSMSGNTAKIANLIKDATSGDIFEIQPEENYYREDINEIGKKQVSEGYKPKLKNKVPDFESYDLIYVGSPVWWFSVSPPVMSFLSQYDFKDKRVVPFCRCKSAFGDFFKQFEVACPGAKVLEGRNFTNDEATDTEKVKEKIGLWVKEIEKK